MIHKISFYLTIVFAVSLGVVNLILMLNNPDMTEQRLLIEYWEIYVTMIGGVLLFGVISKISGEK